MLLILVPVAIEIPAIAALAVANVLIWAMIAYETRLYGEGRHQVRHRRPRPSAGAGSLGRDEGRRVGAERRPVSSAPIAAISSSPSSKSKTSKFSADALGRDRLGDDDVAELQVPAEDRPAPGVLPCRSAIATIAGSSSSAALAERAPGLGRDAVLGVPGAQLGLLEARVQLDLVDRGDDAGLVDQPLEVRRGWKLETPIGRARPSAWSRSNAFQVST